MATLIGAGLYVGSTFIFWKMPTPATHAKTADTPSRQIGPSWDFLNPEADQLMAELRLEKKALEKREMELNEMSLRLQSEKAEMNQVTQAVHQTQLEFDKVVLRVFEEETANLKKLAKVYAAMSPDGAANIMSAMDDASIVKIMLFMKDPETAVVLEALTKKNPANAKRAADLSERVRTSVFRNPPAK